MSKKLFVAWAKFDPNCPFEFVVEEIEIARIYGNGVIETKYKCFVNASYSTNYLVNAVALLSTRNLLSRVVLRIIL